MMEREKKRYIERGGEEEREEETRKRDGKRRRKGKGRPDHARVSAHPSKRLDHGLLTLGRGWFSSRGST